MKRFLARFVNVFAAILVVGMMVGVSAPQPVMAESGVVVDLLVLPASQTVVNGDDFTVTIEARTSDQVVSGIAANLDYDPAYLTAKSIQVHGVFGNELANISISGQVDYSGMSLDSFPSGTLTLATITFTAEALTSSTDITFHTLVDVRESLTGDDSGNFVTRSLTGASVTIRIDSTPAASETVADPVPEIVSEPSPEASAGDLIESTETIEPVVATVNNTATSETKVVEKESAPLMPPQPIAEASAGFAWWIWLIIVVVGLVGMGGLIIMKRRD
ncbi:cohesin domain-containing protein [Chloroflexota bacterium]